jgi:hypothetical protein
MVVPPESSLSFERVLAEELAATVLELIDIRQRL